MNTAKLNKLRDKLSEHINQETSWAQKEKQEAFEHE